MSTWIFQEWMDLIIIGCLLILSGLFSGAETALTAASPSRLRKKAREGSSKASLVEQLQESKESFIGALLLANNLVNITASVLATSVCLRLFGDAGLAMATFIMTIAIFVFAEMLPKSWAIHHPLKSAMLAAPFVKILTQSLSPIIKLFTFIVRQMLRLLGGLQDKRSSYEEELRGAIELHAEEDASGMQERAMLRSILDLDDVDVSEIMVHRQEVFSLDEAMSVEKLVVEVTKNPYTRIPLWRDKAENIVATLHAKALLNALAHPKRAGSLQKSHIKKAIKKPWFIPETTSLLRQLQLFRERKEHFALVVDEYGDFMGVVTLEDILEEIVGDIDDEFDSAKKSITRHEDGTVSVWGDVTIRDLNRRFDWSLSDEDAATIGGLVLHEARVFPKRGRCFAFYGYLFEIVRCRRNRILQIKITPPNGSLPAGNRGYGVSPEPL